MYTESSVTMRMHKDKPEVGSKIKRLRENAGLTRRGLCERLGIPYRTLQEWETGRRTPPGYVIKLLEIYIKEIAKSNE